MHAESRPALAEIDIPIVLEDAGLLAAFAHPNRLLLVGSRGFAQLPPTCISNSNGYSQTEWLSKPQTVHVDEKQAQELMPHLLIKTATNATFVVMTKAQAAFMQALNIAVAL